MPSESHLQEWGKEDSRELQTRLRRLLSAAEKKWVVWEKGLTLAYTPAAAAAETERLCLSQPNTKLPQPTKADGQRVLRLLGLVLLADGRSYTDLVVQAVAVAQRPCLVISWRGLVQPLLFADLAEKKAEK